MQERIDAGAALTAYATAAAAGAKDLKVTDFLPTWGEAPQHKQTPEEMMAVLNAYRRTSKE